MEPQRIDVNRDGWKIEVRADDGLMQITGRSPRHSAPAAPYRRDHWRGRGRASGHGHCRGGQIYELVTAAD